MNEDAELLRLWNEVSASPDDYDLWAKLVQAAEGLEGGLHRNSAPQHLEQYRLVYDRFLGKFPLFFGYWKKYADLEFGIGGTEASELIYERGVAAISSVDLWTQYCEFKQMTSHNPDVIRELYERGANAVGLDFLAHPFWDKYLEFEERQEDQDRVFTILNRIIRIPMHQYARYYERYSRLASSRPLESLAPSDRVAQFRAEIQMESSHHSLSPEQSEQALRQRIEAYQGELFAKVQNETTKRWPYEQEIKRPYFHVTELEDSQLANWRRYLDFEEGEGDYARTAFLYERCMVACAHYEEFWLRFARWMAGFPSRAEEVRNILIRASCLFVPIARPQIRLHWALFEESSGRLSVAHDIYEAILVAMPGHVETIVAWANSVRRNKDIDAAVQVFQGQLSSESLTDINAKITLMAELARFLLHAKGSSTDARQVFASFASQYTTVKAYWQCVLEFETQVPFEEGQTKRVRETWDMIKARVPGDVKELSPLYEKFLMERGGENAAAEWLSIDRELNQRSI